MSRKNRDFFREKSEFLRDRLLLLFIDIARRGLLIAYVAVLSDLSNHIKIFKKELLRVKVKASK